MTLNGTGLWVALSFVLIAGLPASPVRADGLETLQIVAAGGAHEFRVEIANDDATRERGLMYRRFMPADRDREGPVSFWMRNTYIPLDMIFIRGDGRILRIAERTEPLSDRIIPSGGPVRAVLEVAGGTAKKLGIAPGDRIGHPMFNGR